MSDEVVASLGVRVLVTSSAMAGHFGPLVPFVDALLARGDEVLLVAPEAARGFAAPTGAPLLVGGSPDPAEAGELWRRFQTADPREASVIANREIFGRLNTEAMLPAVERAVAEHRPDMVLHETTEYAGPITAMRAEIAHAQVAISPARAEQGSLALAAPVLERHGPIVTALKAAPYLTRFPDQIDPSAYPDTRRYREPTPTRNRLPDWWNGSSAPLIYITFGTVAGGLGTGPYRAAVEALADMPVRVLITTGRDLDLGRLPANVHAQPWVDQRDVLAEAAIVVCHAGSGTTLAALAAAVPMILLPMFADQLTNARSLEHLGVAVVINPSGESASDRSTYNPALPAKLRAAVETALDDAPRRALAQSLAHDLAARPTAAELIDDLAAAIRSPDQ